MDTKETLIRSTIRQLVRVARRYASLEELPVRVDDQRQVTTSEAHTIQAIGENPEANLTRLAEHLGFTTSAASQMATKLEKAGYVRRRRAPYSKRVVLLALTDLGWAAYEAHERAHGKDLVALVEHLSSFSVPQIATLSVLLETIGAVVDGRLSGDVEE